MHEKMTRRVDSLFEADTSHRLAYSNLLQSFFFKIRRRGVGCRGAPLRATTRKFQSCAPFSRSLETPLSRVQQREPTLLISGERLRRLEGTRLRGLSVSRDGRRDERLREARL